MHPINYLVRRAVAVRVSWQDPLTRQLILLTALRAIRMFMIAVPVIAIYWKGFGMDMQDIMVLQVIFSIAMIAFELPSGYLADRFGNKPILVTGALMGVLGYWLFWQFPSYEGFLAGEIALALSASLMSGARDALLYDTLATHNETHRYTAVQGTLHSWGFVSEAVAGVAATSVLVLFSLSTVVLLQLLILLLSVPVVLLLQPHRSRDHQADSLLKIVHYCFYGNKRLLWLNLFTGTVSASTLTMVWYAQVHWESIGVPVWTYGLIWSGLMLVAAAGARGAARVEQAVRFRVLFAGVALAPALLYGLMAALATTMWALGVVWLFWLLRGVSLPIVSDYVQRECTERNRATVLSANALMGRLVFSIVSPFLGAVVDSWSFGTAFMLSALVFGVIAAVGYLNWLTTVRTSTPQ